MLWLHILVWQEFSVLIDWSPGYTLCLLTVLTYCLFTTYDPLIWLDDFLHMTFVWAKCLDKSFISYGRPAFQLTGSVKKPLVFVISMFTRFLIFLSGRRQIVLTSKTSTSRVTSVMKIQNIQCVTVKQFRVKVLNLRCRLLLELIISNRFPWINWVFSLWCIAR